MLKCNNKKTKEIIELIKYLESFTPKLDEKIESKGK